jgi:hypothetical protein
MTVSEILEQVKTLSPEERDELLRRLVVLQHQPEQGDSSATDEHWGKSLNRLLDDIGPIEMKYPEIDDPVAWAKQLRADSRRRVGDWDEVE